MYVLGVWLQGSDGMRVSAESVPCALQAACLDSWRAAGPLQLGALLDAAGVHRCLKVCGA